MALFFEDTFTIICIAPFFFRFFSEKFENFVRDLKFYLVGTILSSGFGGSDIKYTDRLVRIFGRGEGGIGKYVRHEVNLPPFPLDSVCNFVAFPICPGITNTFLLNIV